MEIFQPNSSINLYSGSWENTIKIRNQADLILTSPPYNIGSKSPKKIGGRKLGGYDSKSFAAIDGYEDNMPEDLYQESQKNFLIMCSQMIKENGIIAYNHKRRHKNGKIISPECWFPSEDILVQHDVITLDRKSSHNNETSFFQPCTEQLFIFKKSNHADIYVDKTVTEDFKNIRDVWTFPIIKDHSKNKHCAPFGLSFAREAIFRLCPPGGLVCDPYSGSGTTMIACAIQGRRFIGAEKKKEYYLLSKKRYETLNPDSI